MMMMMMIVMMMMMMMMMMIHLGFVLRNTGQKKLNTPRVRIKNVD